MRRAASGISAEESTITGDFPPSSRVSGVRWRAAAAGDDTRDASVSSVEYMVPWNIQDEIGSAETQQRRAEHTFQFKNRRDLGNAAERDAEARGGRCTSPDFAQ